MHPDIFIPQGEFTALIKASGKGQLEVVELLLARGANVNWNSASGSSALMMACSKGHAKVVELLLKNGASLNQVFLGNALLHRAAMFGRSEVIQTLLKHGCNPAATNLEGKTAAEVASEKGFEIC